MKNTFELDIITPTDTFSFTEVEYLRAPSTEGLFGVMKGHIPSIIALDIGEIKIIENNQEKLFATSGGFADINNNKVVLVVETAEDYNSIDLSRAQESLDRAVKHLNETDVDMKRAMDAIKRAKNRISISKKVN
tara:strand:+ start:1231 stop:1632 length:402 start_codon:yes stop_codon:yes gene_type:complete